MKVLVPVELMEWLNEAVKEPFHLDGVLPLRRDRETRMALRTVLNQEEHSITVSWLVLSGKFPKARISVALFTDLDGYPVDKTVMLPSRTNPFEFWAKLQYVMAIPYGSGLKLEFAFE